MWYYPNEGIIHHKLLQPIEGDNFRNLLMTGLSAIKEHGAQKWLADDRKHSFHHAEESAWSQDIWLPQAAQAGWKYWALLPPEKSRGQVNMQRLMSNVERFKIEVKAFSDPDEAFKWLVSCRST
jgi:hypothetical protein